MDSDGRGEKDGSGQNTSEVDDEAEDREWLSRWTGPINQEGQVVSELGLKKWVRGVYPGCGPQSEG